MTDDELRKLKDCEDFIGKLLHGHDEPKQDPLTSLQTLVLWKRLAIEHPHWSRQVAELDRMILHEIRKK